MPSQTMFMQKIITKLKNDPKTYEFLRFAIVGTIASGIHYLIYYFCQKVMEVNIAYTIGYFTSFLCNFLMTSYFTFRTGPSTKRAVGFGFSHLVNYLMHMFLLNFFLWLGVNKLIAPVFVLMVAVPTNFTLLHFVFKQKKQSEQDS